MSSPWPSAPKRNFRKKYSGEFKQSVTDAVILEGLPLTVAAARFEISISMVYKWVAARRQDFPMTQVAGQWRAETEVHDLNALRKEVAQLREQIDTLRAIVVKAFRARHEN